MASASIITLPAILLIIVLSFIGAILSAKLKFSYTTIMIIIGLGVSFLRPLSGIISVPLDRTIILGLVVPPLIFEAAMRTNYRTFRSVRRTVLSLAILGVILSSILIGLALKFALGLPFFVALTFGVIVSPTDPISVLNILKRLRAPKKLSTILETEAYFNDATAVVLYSIAVSLSFNPLHSAGLFGYSLGAGVLVGLIVSGAAELLYRLITEPLAETYFTVAVMFGSYVFAESIGASGLISVAIAGLYMGNRTMHVAMAKETRRTLTSFWEVVTFMATSFVFLLLGLRVDVSLLVDALPFIGVAFVVILASRFLSVYPIVKLMKLAGETIPPMWTKILAAAGLRGAVTVALALSLPDNFPFRAELISMTFGVALLSIVIQGELVQWYIRRSRSLLMLKPRKRSDDEQF